VWNPCDPVWYWSCTTPKCVDAKPRFLNLDTRHFLEVRKPVTWFAHQIKHTTMKKTWPQSSSVLTRCWRFHLLTTLDVYSAPSANRGTYFQPCWNDWDPGQKVNKIPTVFSMFLCPWCDNIRRTLPQKCWLVITDFLLFCAIRGRVNSDLL